ncbi:hypothetical protein V6N13_057752 [Hibiscus sabdariffa]
MPLRIPITLEELVSQQLQELGMQDCGLKAGWKTEMITVKTFPLKMIVQIPSMNVSNQRFPSIKCTDGRKSTYWLRLVHV